MLGYGLSPSFNFLRLLSSSLCLASAAFFAFCALSYAAYIINKNVCQIIFTIHNIKNSICLPLYNEHLQTSIIDIAKQEVHDLLYTFETLHTTKHVHYCNHKRYIHLSTN
jgi:hypothetical protein